ncbi:Glutamyl-tRNA(Gln) amidotransferase subunit A [Galdieria sulphuraria]|nr:Glutamyl-tRNA(Gln) amidotransferase subunit A [Galdieria sulphuraria]
MFWRTLAIESTFFFCPTCRIIVVQNGRWIRHKRTCFQRSPLSRLYCQTTKVSNIVKKQLADVENSTILSIAETFKRGEWKAVDVVIEYLNRIHEMDKLLGAFLTVDAERALQKAQLLDEKWKNGEHLGPLAAVPVAVKDNLCTKGLLTTAGSRILENFIPRYDATTVSRLEAADAIVVGKTNMDEFGMGSSTELSGFHPSKNPWDPSRVCGGSSGGSAAAVASGMAPFALGSDTGGSIRQPASFCGVCGLKPTYGKVSRFGLVAFSSSLDTVGPMASSVIELATIFQVLAGHDSMDSTSLSDKVPCYTDMLQEKGALDLKGITLGVVYDERMLSLEGFRNINGTGVEDLMRCFQESIRVLTHLNVKVVPISLSFLEEALAAYYVIAPSEASSNLARYDGVRFGIRQYASHISELYQKSRGMGLGSEVKRRILTGTFALSTGYYDAYYRKALQVRQLISQQFENLFQQLDIIVCPTTPCAAFELGEKMEDPVKMYMEDLLTIPASLAGLPAVSIPMGFDSDHMPLGLQLIGNRQREDILFRVGHAFQLATNWHRHRPLIYRNYVSTTDTTTHNTSLPS